jgi:hypothetical protein
MGYQVFSLLFTLCTLLAVQRGITVILRRLDRISLLMKDVIMTLDELQAQVAENITVETSAILLIQGIAAQLAAVANDPAKVQALADSLNTSSDALAAAVTANTSAAPPA